MPSLTQTDNLFNPSGSERAPIDKLPNEILESIFLHFPAQSTRDDSTWLSIMLVCRRWYLVSIACPLIWNNIIIAGYPPHPVFLDRVKLAPLDVTIHISDGDNYVNIARALAVIHEVNHIRHLQLHVPLRQLFQYIPSFITAQASRLESFDLLVTGSKLPDEVVVIPDEIFPGDLSRLRSLSLAGMRDNAYPGLEFSWRNRLFTSNLTALCVSRPAWKSRPSVEELGAVLRCACALESLSLSYALPVATNGPLEISSASTHVSSKIFLPCLTMLRLHDLILELTAVLARLDIPNCAAIYAHAIYDDHYDPRSAQPIAFRAAVAFRDLCRSPGDYLCFRQVGPKHFSWRRFDFRSLGVSDLHFNIEWAPETPLPTTEAAIFVSLTPFFVNRLRGFFAAANFTVSTSSWVTMLLPSLSSVEDIEVFGSLTIGLVQALEHDDKAQMLPCLHRLCIMSVDFSFPLRPPIGLRSLDRSLLNALHSRREASRASLFIELKSCRASQALQARLQELTKGKLIMSGKSVTWDAREWEAGSGSDESDLESDAGSGLDRTGWGSDSGDGSTSSGSRRPE
ncbi:hypothetical protein K488DRAFT_82000 [Vararia minispora EC-137]|uniref:Uncharacterized protein n=1 Tax=Vararia minispora EC-137 TaxID=1314806 RepID=A0ACB8QY30_9AGAM|nr:hypothetical protein K488DRAFT_82000 [Vararia minispora EC-137]